MECEHCAVKMSRNYKMLFAFGVLLLCQVECVKKTRFPIGGIFYDKIEAAAFQKALDKRTSENLRFEARNITPSAADTYTILKEVCKITSLGGWTALVDGGLIPGSCNALCQLCSKVNIPQLFISWRPPEPTASSAAPFGLAYYPQPSVISRAFATLIKIMGWESFTILYEDGDGLIRLQEILKSRSPMAEPVIVRRLNPYGDNRSLFKDVQQQDFFIIDCNPANIITYLNDISAVNNHTAYQEYLLTSLDAHTVDLRQAHQFKGNVSTLHLTNREDLFWNEFPIDETSITLQTALAVDAATHVSMAIEKIMDSNQTFDELPSICQQENYRTWATGTILLDKMKEINIEGRTGNVEFGNSMYRQNIILKLSTNSNKGYWAQTGYWDSSTDLYTLTEPSKAPQRFSDNSTTKLKVLSKDGKPYFGRNKTTGEFEGFAMDLIKAIFVHINNSTNDGTKYDFEFKDVKGGQEEMINTLENKEADLAICDLTVTSDRQRKVDFSMPFMSLGISILFRKPPKEIPDKFSFMQPLTIDLWLYLGTAYILVSFVLLICARMSQEDWVNPHPCNRNPEALENIWTLYNCTWLSMGTIMTQGCDILPRAAGSRWVTGMWWFFTLIITSSYTANVSTFISSDRKSNEITSVKDLSERNDIKYGTYKKGSTYKFFQSSNDPVYKKIFTTMESTKPDPYTSGNDEGMERVESGRNKYAFFMESITIEYYIQRHCNLTMIGGLLDSKEYAIAMPKRSPYRHFIDEAISKLQENAEIAKMKKTWWEDMDNTEKCKEKDEEENANEADKGSLQMDKTSGIFLVLLAGGLLGLAFAITDFFLHAHKIATNENVSWREAIMSEWRSSLNPRMLSKPVAPPRSVAPSLESTSSHDRRSTSRAVSVLRAAQSFINLDKVY